MPTAGSRLLEFAQESGQYPSVRWLPRWMEVALLSLSCQWPPKATWLFRPLITTLGRYIEAGNQTILRSWQDLERIQLA
ncbi:hypothetical protein, partial [uncultured Adlercreutzia sp.]